MKRQLVDEVEWVVSALLAGVQDAAMWLNMLVESFGDTVLELVAEYLFKPRGAG